jgi:hypothetical protein
MKTKPTQVSAVQAALLARKSVDQVEAIHRGWGLRLGAIIHRLRARGWPILTTQDHNNGLARYRLPEGWQTPETQKPQ